MQRGCSIDDRQTVNHSTYQLQEMILSRSRSECYMAVKRENQRIGPAYEQMCELQLSERKIGNEAECWCDHSKLET